MKINTILVAGAYAGILFTTSCQPSMKERQLKYTHTTQVDGDAYQALQIVGEKVPYETDYATYVENNSAVGENRALAAKVRATLDNMIADLDTLATRYNVDFPIRGAKQFQAENENRTVVMASDSTTLASAPATHSELSDEHYAHHVQHEVAEIKEQFSRLSRNTNKDLRDYAASKLEALSTLYKEAGGKEEAGGHH
ncbi:hypothetical protein M8998_00390 [Sphingobacterium sp. lm-10]|uniref:hypothetical protein n=1 Tax=Sphingobacterium sp. lm-10 TaxID=2944904 RepID=UPI00201FC475|nr:hypothetical protein [Sphingobacterium sp. lm-10]MCL7986389.1 hypothetical protein [Sphingobacterium sp. lm-10]